MLNKLTLKLLDVPLFPAVIETSQILFKPSTTGYKNERSLKFVYTSRISRETGSRILMVTFFCFEARKAVFRIFFDGKNFVNEFLSPKRKWSNATLYSIWDECCEDNSVCANAKSAKIIKKFFGSEELPFKAMKDFQYALRQSQLAMRHQKEIDIIDERMKSIRPLPKDFEKWVNEVPLDFSRYIYYKRVENSLIKGYCTSCGNDLELRITKKTPYKNVRHNKKGKCPRCQKLVTFKAEGRAGYIVDSACATYIQKTKTGFVLRFFKATKKYYSDPTHYAHYRHPLLSTHESDRHFFDCKDGIWSKTGAHYEFGEFKQTGNYRWCKSIQDGYTYTSPLYTRNLRQALADSPWKYSAFYELVKNVQKIPIQRYMEQYLLHPAYEYLIKARLYKLVAGKMGHYYTSDAYLRFEGKSLLDILDISKNGFRQLQRLNGGCRYLSLIRVGESCGKSFTDKQLHTFAEMEINKDLLAELLEYASPQKIINYISCRGETWKTKGYGHSNPVSSIATSWRDYLNNCKLLGYDMASDFIIYPRDLRERHDAVVEEYKVEKNAIQETAILGLRPALQNVFGYADEKLGLVAVAPANRDELIAEGQVLRHCVHTGSYISNMVSGKGYILFVRKADEPETPYFTAEVVDGVIRQCRGEHNCEMPSEVKTFVNHWQKRLEKANAKTFAPAAYARAA